MCKIFLLVIFSLSVSESFSQTSQTTYYDDKGQEGSKENCFYYTVRRKPYNDVDSIVSYFCKTDVLKSVTYVDGRGRWMGDRRMYSESGRLISKEKYDDYKQIDSAYAWYADGSLRQTKFYGTKEARDSKILFYRDSLGKVLVENGYGYCQCRWADGGSQNDFIEEGAVRNGLMDSLWIAYDLNGKKLHEDKYSKGEFLSGISWDKAGKTYQYTVIEETAVPVEGMNAFYAFVAKNILYPKEAKKKSIEGKVFVQFIVEKDGSIGEVKTIKGIGGGCDEEAEIIVRQSPKWKPGIQRGQLVRQKMVLPINFKLG
jgi:TonB family protein